MHKYDNSATGRNTNKKSWKKPDLFSINVLCKLLLFADDTIKGGNLTG